eukprot:scaffold173854_cov49-Prasinocladus_malaysianus.AAC.2
MAGRAKLAKAKQAVPKPPSASQASKKGVKRPAEPGEATQDDVAEAGEDICHLFAHCLHCPMLHNKRRMLHSFMSNQLAGNRLGVAAAFLCYDEIEGGFTVCSSHDS